MDSLVQNMRPQLGSSHRIRAIFSSILGLKKGYLCNRVRLQTVRVRVLVYPGTRYVRTRCRKFGSGKRAFSVPGYTNEDTVELRSELHLDLR